MNETTVDLPAGDRLIVDGRAALLWFAAPRRTLSSSPLCGGLREDLRCVFNFDERDAKTGECRMRALTYREHLALVARELGLAAQTATGLSTAAQMCNLATAQQRCCGCTVTAFVTGGVDVNGGRAGEPALWTERCGVPEPFVPGTVNILLHLDADLDPGGMATALMLCTEAKAAVLQELCCPSCSSSALATGTGTDGTVIICNPSSPLKLFHAGQHYKLGEMIGKTVSSALREALFLQTGLCPQAQHSVLSRLGRYGVGSVDSRWENDPAVVAISSVCAHLLDQLGWGMLSPAEAAGTANYLLQPLGGMCGRDFAPLSLHCTAEKTKNELIRSLSLLLAP